MRALLCAVAVLLIFHAQSGSAADIIIEACKTGKNNPWYKEPSGSWITSANPPATAKSSARDLSPSQECGSRMVLLDRPQTAAARWQPEITEAGEYFVYVTWPTAANAADVLYVIKHADGEVTRKHSQNGWGYGGGTANANQWIALGKYKFNAGADQYVEIKVTPEMTGVDAVQHPRAYADSVRFTTTEIPSAGGIRPAPPARPVETVVIESREQGKNYSQYKELSGKWIDSSGKSGAQFLTPAQTCGSRKSPVGPGAGGKPAIAGSVHYFPKLEVAGHYYVYATWPREANADPVVYVVNHANGQDTKKLVQDGWGRLGKPTADRWVLIGDYDFKPGDDQFVELKHTGEDVTLPDPGNPGQMFADGILFSLKKMESTAGPAAASVPRATGSSASADVPPIEWLTDLGTARVRAGRENKKLLLFFFSPESTLSQDYDIVIFRDSAVRKAINRDYIAVRLNHPENRELANQLRVFKAATVLLYDADGNGLNKISGKKSQSEFLKEIQ